VINGIILSLATANGGWGLGPFVSLLQGQDTPSVMPVGIVYIMTLYTIIIKKIIQSLPRHFVSNTFQVYILLSCTCAACNVQREPPVEDCIWLQAVP
jgi:hypothetical protein